MEGPHIPGTPHSITSAPSFQSRLVQAERWRLALLAFCFAAVLVMWLIRRALHGGVASSDAAFYPVTTILTTAVVALIASIAEINWRIRRNLSLPAWRSAVGTVLDLAVPFSVLLVLQFESPRGAFAALSGPTLLTVPIVILLSILRLRPGYSLTIGLCAAAAHWALAAIAVHRQNLEAPLIPLLAAYGILLALTGIAACAVSIFVRKSVQEAVAEAEAAERAGRALQNIEHELEIAHSIQMGLLPSQPPAFPGYDIAGMARPAALAGGDYYDWETLPDGRLVIAIADVTGHGIGPALVMAVCRAYSRATTPTASSAADFLERMNRFIVKDITDGRFITMAYAVIAPDGAVEFLSAGHGPSFCFRAATGEVEEFGGDGLPLGVMDDERYEPTRRLKLNPGDVLVLMTDGFVERADPQSNLFGINRVRAVLAANATRTAAQIIAAMDEQCAAFAGSSPQGDDMTMVVLRRTG